VNVAPKYHPNPPTLRFTEADSERANKEWKASCGPHAIAAAFGLSLEEVRPACIAAGFRGWMNPTQVSQVLVRLGKVTSLRSGLKTAELCNGINRIQWEGKWLNPGVPARVAYKHTHYVAHFSGFVLCTGCECAKWITASSWRHFLLNVEPKSPFHVTHHYAIA
jgi:hypothetical protein